MKFLHHLAQSGPLFLTRGGVVALNFLTTLCVAAFLTPSDFGRFVYLWSLAQVLSAIAAMGGPAYLLREAAARQGDPSRGVTPREAAAIAIFAPIALLAILGTAIWILGGILPDWLGAGLLPSEIAVVVSSACILIALAHLATPFRVRGMLTLSMFLRDAAPHLALLLGLFMALAIGRPLPIIVLVGLTLTGAIIVIVFGIAAFWPRSSPLQLWRAPDGKRGSGLSSFWGSAVLGTTTSQIDILLGGLVLGSVELGQYQILKRLANLATLPLIVANWTVIVGLGKAFAQGDTQTIQSLCRKGAALCFVPGLFLLVAVAAAMPAFLWLYELPNSILTWATFAMLGAGCLVNLAFGVNFTAASQCHLETQALLARAAGVAVSTATILAFGADLSPLSLALSTVLSLWITNAILWLILKRRLGVDTSIINLWPRRKRAAP